MFFLSTELLILKKIKFREEINLKLENVKKKTLYQR